VTSTDTLVGVHWRWLRTGGRVRAWSRQNLCAMHIRRADGHMPPDGRRVARAVIPAMAPGVQISSAGSRPRREPGSQRSGMTSIADNIVHAAFVKVSWFYVLFTVSSNPATVGPWGLSWLIGGSWKFQQGET